MHAGLLYHSESVRYIVLVQDNTAEIVSALAVPKKQIQNASILKSALEKGKVGCDEVASCCMSNVCAVSK